MLRDTTWRNAAEKTVASCTFALTRRSPRSRCRCTAFVGTGCSSTSALQQKLLAWMLGPLRSRTVTLPRNGAGSAPRKADVRVQRSSLMNTLQGGMQKLRLMAHIAGFRKCIARVLCGIAISVLTTAPGCGHRRVRTPPQPKAQRAPADGNRTLPWKIGAASRTTGSAGMASRRKWYRDGPGAVKP